jgi:hypothetical protein
VPKKFLSPEETLKARSGACPECGGPLLGPPVERGATHQYVECMKKTDGVKTCRGAYVLPLVQPRKRGPRLRFFVHYDGALFGFGERDYKRWLRASAALNFLASAEEHGGERLGQTQGVLDWEGDDFREELKRVISDARERKEK